MSQIILYLTLAMLLKYLLWCYVFMAIYISISVFVRSQVTKYHIFLLLIAPISTPYHLIYVISNLLTNMDED